MAVFVHFEQRHQDNDMLHCDGDGPFRAVKTVLVQSMLQELWLVSKSRRYHFIRAFFLWRGARLSGGWSTFLSRTAFHRLEVV